MGEDKSHVVVVSQHYPPDKSGNASRIRDTCTHLANEDWEVTVLAPPPAFPHGQFERTWKRKTTQADNGITVHRLWAWQPTKEDPSFISRMAYYLFFPLHALMWLLFNYREYDIVITSAPPIFTGLAALPLGIAKLKPWIVDVRDLWIDASVSLGFISEGGLLERLSRAYEGFVLRKADGVTVTTAVLGDRLTRQYSVEEEKIIHLPNGVDTARFQPSDNDQEPVVVYTGNVGHAQDIESCIQALSKLNTPDIRLKIVGDGDIKSELEQLVEVSGLTDSVEFTGLVSRDKIPEILRSSTIGIAPLKSDDSLEYAVPTKVYEYMAAELPVVVTGTGEIVELVEEANAGIVADNNPESIAEAFHILLEDEEARTDLGANGREYVTDKYDRKEIAKKLNQTLETKVK